MPVISVTRLRVRSFRYLPGFIFMAVRSARQARRHPENLGSKLLRDANNAFWTCTAWRSDASMKNFMLAGPHRRAMSRLAHWCDEASVVHWNQETAVLPEWPEAHRRMMKEGRPPKVNHPSAAHLAHEIPGPRIG
jgi:hypothetical protein